MKFKTLTILVFFIITNIVSSCYSQPVPQLTDTSVVLPTNLAEAINILDAELNENQKLEIKEIKRENLGRFHFGYSMEIRSKWRLWDDSELALWFKENGIYHPDDMSNLIIEIYWKYLNGLPLSLKESVTKLRDEYDDIGARIDNSAIVFGDESEIIPLPDPAKVKNEFIDLED